MKPALACGVLLLAALILAAGCASGPPSGASSAGGGARCLSRPDTSGTQPLFYLFCVQSN
jgi:hypothetical protein